MDEYNRAPMRGNRRRTMVGHNVNPRGYGERQSYWVKAKIPNFVRNLDIKAVLDWLYEVDKFFDIMEVPEEEQVKVVAYRLCGGAGAWWQREQDNRRAQGRRPMDTWMRMKRMIKESVQFLRFYSSSNYGSRPNPIQSTIPSTTTTTSSSKASGGGGDKNKESQPINSNPYARSNVCPKRSTYYSIESRNDGLTINEAFQKEDELEYVEPLDGEAEQVTYVIQRTLCLPKLLKSNRTHPNLYKFGRYKGRKATLKVTKICKVPLAIGKHYNELVTCDVVDMEACHVLLGRPWQHVWDVQPRTLVTLVGLHKRVLAERKETGVSYALVVKGVEDVMKNAIPAVIKPLLAEFGKIMTDDTPDALPPLMNIQHQIDLRRKTTLLVSISNEVLGFDSIKELYTSDEDFGNIWMELETKQHRGEFLLLDGYLFKGNRLCIPKTYIKSQLVKEIHAK
ncbi:hypothetical protein Tco_1122597 [Tanacetum coccineum]|uniref:Retrotransposon gag domain-containing protein n=1 Tax=Tanacetum coccineum TaxID=301880 RepID=A0ABQ5J3A6_9ASTR